MTSIFSIWGARLPLCFALVFAPSLSAAVYYQDFTLPDGTTDLGDGSVIQSNDGIASVQGGKLRLTSDGTGSTAAAFFLPAMEYSSQGWSAVFNFSLIDGFEEGVPADGFSFNYGDITPTAGQYGAAEAGYGPGGGASYVGIIVDTYQQGNLADLPKVGVVQNVGGLASTIASTAGTVVGEGTTREGIAILVYDPLTGLDFTTIGLETNADFNNVALPGFVSSDTFSFVFSARTGGADQTLLIDNLSVTTVPEPGVTVFAALTGIAGIIRRRR